MAKFDCYIYQEVQSFEDIVYESIAMAKLTELYRKRKEGCKKSWQDFSTVTA
jgi:hypothetical protein